MAKRFTDTEKWKRPWFAELPLIAKLVWVYLLDDCDHRGVWVANFRRLSFDLGEDIGREEFLSWFGSKVIEIEEDKFFIPSFVEFQNPKLNPNNNAHKGILDFLDRYKDVISSSNLAPGQPPVSPSRGAQVKVKVRVDSSSNGDAPHPSGALSPEVIARCTDAWLETMHHFGVRRRIGMHDQTQLARAVQQFGIDDVLLALRGARFEAPTQTFRPKDHLSLERIFGRDKQGNLRIGKFLNLAGQEQNAPTEREVYRPGEKSC